MTRKVKGFTLIELAIVVAIIGLIAGTIFVSGGALFKSSKTAKTISIINELSEGILQFKNTYKGLPGDLLVNGELESVHDDCKSGGANAGNNDERILGNERLCVIEHLSRAGLIKSDGISDDGLRLIKSPFGGVEPTIRISHPSASEASTVSWGRFVPVVVAILGLPCDVIEEIDRKIDDGILNDGRARSIRSDGSNQSTCSEGSTLVVAL
jgi:prepilin-type N-terminal cleavage/methylation domain-containing protein